MSSTATEMDESPNLALPKNDISHEKGLRVLDSSQRLQTTSNGLSFLKDDLKSSPIGAQRKMWRMVCSFRPCIYEFCNGTPGEIRTPDLLVRSQVLYPAELRAQSERALYRKAISEPSVSPSIRYNNPSTRPQNAR